MLCYDLPKQQQNKNPNEIQNMILTCTYSVIELFRRLPYNVSLLATIGVATEKRQPDTTIDESVVVASHQRSTTVFGER